MRRLTYAFILLSLACLSTAQAQTTQTPAATPAVDNCACESQVLPETVANVNGVKITAVDLKKATGDTVTQLQRQVIEARKLELDLMIN